MTIQRLTPMKTHMPRRRFLHGLGAGAALLSLNSGCRNLASPTSRKVQPIRGSWVSVWWDDRRHFYWNDPCLQFTAEQWQLAVKDVAELGFEYLVLLAIAKGGKAFYDTPLLPKLEMACADPIGALLTGADKYGVKFFISSDWYAEWDERALHDPGRVAKRFQMMQEIAARYGKHRSFYGWYWPNEAHLSPYFTDNFIRHVNECSREARRLTPKAKTLTAPYGTNKAVCDDQFVRQLERLDVDIIAYQDEVGCLRMTAEQSAVAFERLRRAHDRVPQRALWADVETFAWEGPPNKQTSPLIPAPFERVRAQLEAVSPYVDKVLIYQYQGLMNKPGSRAFAGHPESGKLYEDYVAWLRSGRRAQGIVTP
jgi:hypothetical protein